MTKICVMPDKENLTPLFECVSPETAHVQPDYPYGRRLRCQRRVWVETNPRYGMRLVTQTSNPKRAKLVWNTPHAGTYSDLIALYTDENDHIHTDSLTNIEYYPLEQLDAWASRNVEFLQVNEYARNKFNSARANRVAYEARKANGEIKVKVVKHGVSIQPDLRNFWGATQ